MPTTKEPSLRPCQNVLITVPTNDQIEKKRAAALAKQLDDLADPLGMWSVISSPFGSSDLGALRRYKSLMWHGHTARFAPSIASRKNAVTFKVTV